MLTLQNPEEWLDKIKAPVDEIGAQAEMPDLYDRVKASLSNGEAFLFAEGDSFCVFRPRGYKVLECWVAHGKQGNEIIRHRERAKALGREVGAVAFEFWTVLPGLNRLAKRLGFERVREDGKFTVWRMPI